MLPARPNQKSGTCRTSNRYVTQLARYKFGAEVDVPLVSVVRRAAEVMLWSRSSSQWASRALLVLSFLLSAVPVSLSIGAATKTLLADPPRKSNGLTDVVQWDNYSLFVNDQRIFLQYVLPSHHVVCV